MNHTESRSLERLAHFHGIQTSYLDVNGQTQTASTDTLSAILEVLGIDIRRGVREALRDSEEARAAELLEPVSVVQGRARTILLRIPSNWMDKPIQFRIRTENGDALEWSTRASKLKTRAKFGVGRSSGLIKQFSFPNLPHGYHDLTVQCVGKTFNSLLICAPTQSYSDPELSRAWGAFLPMYAVRSDQGWGAGGYREWGQLGQWVGAHGGKILGSLPILAAFLDKQSCEPSPYSPVSRHFWNEFYLDVPSLPGFADCPEARRLVDSAKFQKRLARFRSSDAVEYCDEMFEKRKVLEILAQEVFLTTFGTRGIRALCAAPSAPGKVCGFSRHDGTHEDSMATMATTIARGGFEKRRLRCVGAAVSPLCPVAGAETNGGTPWDPRGERSKSFIWTCRWAFIQMATMSGPNRICLLSGPTSAHLRTDSSPKDRIGVSHPCIPSGCGLNVIAISWS